ncbi:hypothetical protein QQZ08_000196 [Neonectria magnoliae]|uniref:Uncharacterized protein n=1 Tax=Neonectria magnoliae TaxID=2732573 RepID=A0ABR1IHY4_9HYPO
MAKLLLSSSQVQVIASGFVIILCTFALFFSGYMIQQRTLRELRFAIQPRGPSRGSRPSPQAYLPERFRETTTELEDGTIVTLESEAQREAREQRVMIEVKQTKPGEEVEKVGKPSDEMDKAAKSKVNPEAQQKNIDIVEEFKAKMSEKISAASQPGKSAKKSKPLTRAQRRKMIKQDLQRSAQLEEPAYYQRRMW